MVAALAGAHVIAAELAAPASVITPAIKELFYVGLTIGAVKLADD